MTAEQPAPEPSSPAVEVRGARRVFGGGPDAVVAVDAVDLTVPRGQILALLGQNGAGKTTLLDMVLGLSAPTSGTVEVLGLPPRRAAASGRIAALLQTGGLLHDLTVRETLTAIAGLQGAGHRLEAVIDHTGLRPLLRRRVGRCSGGEQQRLKFALALLPDPEVLVLDEPTAGMDAGARRAFWATMRAEADDGRTVVFATHYLEEAQEFAERTVVMAHGRVIGDDSTASLRGSISGRELQVRITDEDAGRLLLDRLTAREEVRAVRREGDRIFVTSVDSDSTARLVLAEPKASDLEITAPTLETAYLALTGEERSAVRTAEEDPA